MDRHSRRFFQVTESQDSSVSVVIRLRVGRPVFDSLQEQGFSLFQHRVQTGSGAYPASYVMRNWDCFSEGEAAEALSWTLYIYLRSTFSWRCA
jgi:hypothetical protein